VIKDIENAMQLEIDQKRLAGVSLKVRRAGEVLYENQWGYADIENRIPVKEDTIFRFMSSTKVVTAVAVMMLVEEGRLTLDDKVEDYYPGFGKLKVVADPKFEKPENVQELMQRNGEVSFDDIPLVDAIRPITIRDLLSHASGLALGTLGALVANNLMQQNDTLQDRVTRWSENLCADTQPGEYAFYSALVGFDILSAIVEKITDKTFGDFLKERLFEPLDMEDSCFHLKEVQKSRLAKLYRYDKDKGLTDVTGSAEDIYTFATPKYECGSGGLFSTVRDYEHMVQMLAQEGMYSGRQILKPDTVRLMRTQAQPKQLLSRTFMPGAEWGLGVIIWKDPSLKRPGVPEGTFGWSGGFGTHCFIDPASGLEATVGINLSNIEGMGCFSPVNKMIEKLVFENWG